MKKKVIAIITFISILAIISSICFGLQNDKKTKGINKIETTTRKDFVYVSDKHKVLNIPQIHKEINEVKPKNTSKSIDIQEVSEDNLEQKLSFNSEESQMLMKIAMAEAGGEGKECMALVMLTVLNRTKSNKFPNNIYNVIHEVNNGTYQFTPVANGAYAAAIPSEECREALNLIMSGWDKSQNALYFESCQGSSWHSRNLQFLYRSGKMKFYK